MDGKQTDDVSDGEAKPKLYDGHKQRKYCYRIRGFGPPGAGGRECGHIPGVVIALVGLPKKCGRHEAGFRSQQRCWSCYCWKCCEAGHYPRTEIQVGDCNESLGPEALVRKTENVFKVELRDLDGMTTSEEIIRAIKREADTAAEEVKVLRTWNTYGGSTAAVILAPKDAADKLLKRQA